MLVCPSPFSLWGKLIRKAPVSKWPGRLCAAPPSTHYLVLGLSAGLGSMPPCCLQVAKTIKLEPPMETSFATSDLITFLLDYCSSLPGLPAAHRPLCPAAPEGAFQPTHSVPTVLCLRDMVPASGVLLLL